MKDLILKIDGMSCGHCVGQVTKVLTQLDGVQVKTVKPPGCVARRIQ